MLIPRPARLGDHDLIRDFFQGMDDAGLQLYASFVAKQHGEKRDADIESLVHENLAHDLSLTLWSFVPMGPLVAISSAYRIDPERKKGCDHIPPEAVCELAVIVHPSFRRSGIGMCAVRYEVRASRLRQEGDSILLCCDVHNRGSGTIARKLGFQPRALGCSHCWKSSTLVWQLPYSACRRCWYSPTRVEMGV